MKVKISKDEWYPVFTLSDEYGEEREVPAATVRRWKRAEAAFDAAQNEMGQALNTPERKCWMCGELIRHDGKFWAHVYCRPGHPAEPG